MELEGKTFGGGVDNGCEYLIGRLEAGQLTLHLARSLVELHPTIHHSTHSLSSLPLSSL